MAQSTTLDTPAAYGHAYGRAPGSPYLQVGPMRQDTRLSSMHSLAPEEQDESDHRRKLLLIYIHGFMGDESSFRSFPAHVHNLVTITLSESHVVHTKIYPRYKSRRTLDVVAEDFSAWLTPHETPTTDIILLGHSMGGLLSSEVVLLHVQPPPDGRAFRHRILGTINFDVPFLGMHPGVIATGLASLFTTAPPTQESAAQGAATPPPPSQSSLLLDAADTAAPPPSHHRDTLFSPPSEDRYFNEPYANDVNLPAPRKGWRSTLHFVRKHAEQGLRQAAAQYVRSHAEFGGAMADYRGLRVRYGQVRALEVDEEAVRSRVVLAARSGGAVVVPRVRFVNYYTACWGRPKREKGDGGGSEARSVTPASSAASLSGVPSPRILEETGGSEVIVPISLGRTREAASQNSEPEADGEVASMPPSDLRDSVDSEAMARASLSENANLPLWPPLSPPPMEPVAPDYSAYQDKAVQDALKKEHERRAKAYKQAMKDREATLAERKKVEDKIRKAAEKLAAKSTKREEKEKGSLKMEAAQNSSRLSENRAGQALEDGLAAEDTSARQTTSLSIQRGASRESESEMRRPSPPRSPSPREPKKMKDKKFCMLPPKDDAGPANFQA